MQSHAEARKVGAGKWAMKQLTAAAQHPNNHAYRSRGGRGLRKPARTGMGKRYLSSCSACG